MQKALQDGEFHDDFWGETLLPEDQEASTNITSCQAFKEANGQFITQKPEPRQRLEARYLEKETWKRQDKHGEKRTRLRKILRGEGKDPKTFRIFWAGVINAQKERIDISLSYLQRRKNIFQSFSSSV